MCSTYVLSMSRRTTPQHKTDDAAFPVRVYLRAPDAGLGGSLDALYQWLAGNLDRGDYAVHAGGRFHGAKAIEDRIAIYTRNPEIAAAMLEAIPELELSDSTEAITYKSPALPFGRSG